MICFHISKSQFKFRIHFDPLGAILLPTEMPPLHRHSASRQSRRTAFQTVPHPPRDVSKSCQMCKRLLEVLRALDKQRPTKHLIAAIERDFLDEDRSPAPRPTPAGSPSLRPSERPTPPSFARLSSGISPTRRAVFSVAAARFRFREQKEPESGLPRSARRVTSFATDLECSETSTETGSQFAHEEGQQTSETPNTSTTLSPGMAFLRPLRGMAPRAMRDTVSEVCTESVR